MKSHVFLCIVLALVAGCSYPVKITRGSEAEKIPNPVFRAVDRSNESTYPKYTDIKVFERNGCEVPYCPLVWHVSTNKNQGANEIQYGEQQGFGGLYLVPPKRLRPNGKYELLLGNKRNGSHTVQGVYRFDIDSEGHVVDAALEN